MHSSISNTIFLQMMIIYRSSIQTVYLIIFITSNMILFDSSNMISIMIFFMIRFELLTHTQLMSFTAVTHLFSNYDIFHKTQH